MLDHSPYVVAVAWTDVGLAALASLLVGLALWLFLPRGVVLTRTPRAPQGEQLGDTWEVRNASPVPVRVRSVKIAGAITYNDETGKIEYIDLAWDGFKVEDYESIDMLRFDDETLEIGRQDWQRPWRDVTIPPGDTLEAHVPMNMSMYIYYRRAGWSGLAERRLLVVHGGV